MLINSRLQQITLVEVVHRELASHVVTWDASSWECCNMGVILFGVWLTSTTSALERKLKSSPLLRSTCKNFFQFLGIRAEATTLWRQESVHSCLTYIPFLWLLHAFRALATQAGQEKDFKWNQRDACVQHTALYKAHKQEGTIALVSMVHKQGALGTSSQASLHQWSHWHI